MSYNTTDTAEQPPETIASDDGDEIKEVIELWQKTLNDYASYQDAQNENWAARHCQWAGQTKDQRKHSVSRGGKHPFPWDGASDLKYPMVDETINYAVALDLTSLSRANMMARPTGTDDLAKAAVMSNWIKFVIHSQLKERRAEATLLSQYRHERGLSVMRVGWEKLEQKVLTPLKLADLAQSPQMKDVAQAITTGAFDDTVVDLFMALAEQSGQKLSKKRARMMVEELRETGETTAPTIISTVNRAKLKTLAPGEDIFFPASTPIDIQEASAIFERVWLTPAATRGKIRTDGWDEDYTNYVADRCVSDTGGTGDLIDSDYRYQTSRVAGGRGPDLREGLCEWIFGYQKLTDEDGVTGIYCTVFCPSAKDDKKDNIGYAKHGLLPYRSGKYPYVPFPKEILSRCALDTRGAAETGSGFQNASKVEMDSRVDGASLSTCPPRFHPPGREATEWGPGSSVSARRADEYGYFPSAANPGNSIEVQNRIEKINRSYNGRPTDEFDANEATTKQRMAVEDFLTPWEKVAEMIWELYQQYGPDEEWFRVIGVPQERAQQFKKADYSSKWDFSFTFDVLNNDPEQQLTRIEKIVQMAAQLDDQGLFNKGEAMRIMAEAIDPNMAERLILPEETASNREIKGTREDITQMVAGIDTDAPNNANTQLRMNIIHQWMKGPDDNPATDVQQMAAEGTPLRKRIERYTKQLSFQDQQRKNAQIGRVGTSPAYQ